MEGKMFFKILFALSIVAEFVTVPIFLKYYWPKKCKQSLIFKMISATLFVICGFSAMQMSGNNTSYAAIMLIRGLNMRQRSVISCRSVSESLPPERATRILSPSSSIEYPIVARPNCLFMRLYSFCCSVNFAILPLFLFRGAKLIKIIFTLSGGFSFFWFVSSAVALFASIFINLYKKMRLMAVFIFLYAIFAV